MLTAYCPRTLLLVHQSKHISLPHSYSTQWVFFSEKRKSFVGICALFQQEPWEDKKKTIESSKSFPTNLDGGLDGSRRPLGFVIVARKRGG
jgi:hypothetical protein